MSMAIVVAVAGFAALKPRPALSLIDTMIYDGHARDSLHGLSQSEIERKLGHPDSKSRDGSEWYYSQEDTSRLWPMQLSKSLVLRFKDGAVKLAYPWTDHFTKGDANLF